MLTGADYQNAVNAVLSLTSYEEAKTFYKESFGENLANIVENTSMATLAFKLISRFESRGQIPALLQAIDAWNARPKPPLDDLRAIAKTHLGIEGLSDTSPILQALKAAYNLPKP